MNLSQLHEYFPFPSDNDPATTSATNTQYRYQSRELATTSTSSPALKNPIVSIYVGETIIFDVSNGIFPTYLKDSLLNTNPVFDYTAFRNLEIAATSTGAVSTFSFTFNQAGNYVFQLSSSPSSITIISVLNRNIGQSVTTQFVEFSNSNLVVLGVKQSDSVVVGPNWALVIGILLGILGLVLVIVAFLYYFRKRSWSQSQINDPFLNY